MFKVAKNLSVPVVSEIFGKQNHVYDFRNPYEFVLPEVDSAFHGIESVSYLGPHICSMV